MRTAIVRLVAACAMFCGALALTSAPASATPYPPLNTLTTASIGGQNHPCNIYFAHGNSGGVAYAKAMAQTTSDCTRNAPYTYQCPLEVLYSNGNGHCFYSVRLAYRRSNGTSGASYSTFYSSNAGTWTYAVGPAGSTILSSQLYVTYWDVGGPNCGSGALPSCDPLVADTQPAYVEYVYLRAYYSGV